ncbi:MAG TPA: S9 family peptidase [Pyrinomonadaceae bacterium]|nr:S9 family peptidase [Pyrinomonadaceae bacterium]
MRSLSPVLSLLLLLLPVAAPSAVAQNNISMNSTPNPPSAKRVARTATLHGETWTDEYFWLREKKNPEVISYLQAENAYAEAVMKPTEPLQAKLYKEMLARIKETDTNVPYREGAYLYYTRTEQGKQYPIYARRKGSMQAPEQITLDLNEMAKGHTFMSINSYDVSADGHLLAYSSDTTGFREYVLHVKDLRTGETTKIAERVSSAAWANDNKTLFYTTDDPTTKRPFRVHRHTLGKQPDEVLYEEKDELFNAGVDRTRSRGFILLTLASHTTSEVRYLSADKPSGAFRIVEPRQPGHEYYVDHRADRFYVRTNMDGARNFRLASAPVADPGRKNWKEVIPYRKEVMLGRVDLFADYMVLSERENGLPRLRITDLRSDKAHNLEFPEPVYSASLGINPEFKTDTLRYNYQSFVTPSSVYDYDIRARKSELRKRQDVLGGYDPTRSASERVYATAPDGTRVPVSVYYRKDLKRDGSRPMLLYAYGSYGYPSNVGFNSARLSLVDRGVVYALAHIRGGGDLGKEWHDQGRMMNKKNTFTDFIAAAEYLVREKYTSPDRLAIMGGSAGGLLMGAVTNMRPDLFKAVVSHVPFVDVINTMADASLPLTAGEWEEWGNPIQSKEHFAYMKSYSPYDNLAARDYPAMLVKTSLNDSQVMYWEPAKYVARLRTLKTDKNPLLFKTNMGAGHGGASGRYDALKELAFDYAFILAQLGITE